MQPTRRVPLRYHNPAPVYASASRPLQPEYVVAARRGIHPLWYLLLGVTGLIAATLFTVGAALLLFYTSGRILPGVTSLGVALGGQSVEDAATALTQNGGVLTLRDSERVWQIALHDLGIQVDANATANAAQARGRGDGSFISAMNGEPVSPVLHIDGAAVADAVRKLAATVDVPARNATIRVVNGALQAVPAAEGRSLDVARTTERLLRAAADELRSGEFELSIAVIRPNVVDATLLLDRARSLLASPLSITVSDAVTGQAAAWNVAPAQWGQWLSTENTANGVNFAVDPAGVSAYLTAQAGSLGADRSIDIDGTVKALNRALAAGSTSASARVQYKSTTYRVGAGETLYGIAWQIGIPGWKIAKVNPGVNMDVLSAGQVITLPPKDANLEKPVIAGKRIVISISQQRMRVYEHGALKWDWAASTGISSSPTMPGVFQILSHERSAYAGNWNLDMPNFMGIFEAVPGFTNGIHGMPTRNGYSILWESSLGRPVTFGCILLSNPNSQALYAWAEEGVVVEVQR